MARSALTNITDSLMSDSGSVLFSFVKGEQLEFPVNLNFLSDVTAGYSYEAVVIEALNVPFDTTRPTEIKVGGIQTILSVRLPIKRGTWNGSTGYTNGDVALYEGIYYEFTGGVNVGSEIIPPESPLWEETTLRKLYLQFLQGLGSGWEVQPTVGFPTYGFFELRVTEPAVGLLFRKTWKPVRGMVQIFFSPTDVVDD